MRGVMICDCEMRLLEESDELAAYLLHGRKLAQDGRC